MQKSLPPLTWLRAFEAAARHLSFTHAAEELGFTQSAISQHVRALEQRIGTPLFIRRHRMLSLTDAGRLLLPDVAEAMAQLNRATSRFLPEVTKPKLTIAASASIAHCVLAPHLVSFQHHHPDVAIQLITTVWPDDFAATSADVEIRFGAPSIVGQGAELLEPSFLQVVAAPDVANSLPKSLDWYHLIEVALIQPVGISTTWAQIGADNGLPTKLEAQYFVDTHGMAVALAERGAGVALAHCHAARDAISSGALVDLKLGTMKAHEGYYIARNTSAAPDLQSRFVTWLTSILTYEAGPANRTES